MSARYPDGTYPSVNAKSNWWGRNHLSYIAGRIWERRDDDNLIRVEYEPFLADNRTVLDGKSELGMRRWEVLVNNGCKGTMTTPTFASRRRLHTLLDITYLKLYLTMGRTYDCYLNLNDTNGI
jgi:hypothetical protein